MSTERGHSLVLLLHGGCLLHVLGNEASGGGKEDAGCKEKLQQTRGAVRAPHSIFKLCSLLLMPDAHQQECPNDGSPHWAHLRLRLLLCGR